MKADKEYQKAFGCSEESSVSSNSRSMSISKLYADSNKPNSHFQKKSVFEYVLPRYYYDKQSSEETLQQKFIKV